MGGELCLSLSVVQWWLSLNSSNFFRTSYSLQKTLVYLVVVVLRKKKRPRRAFGKRPPAPPREPKGKPGRPFILRSARWRVKRWSNYHISLFFNDNAQRSKK